MSKPATVCAQALANMFPTSKPAPTIVVKVFDPLGECVASSAQRKKSCRMKPVNVIVVLIPSYSSLVVPKGRKRIKLAEENRSPKA